MSQMMLTGAGSSGPGGVSSLLTGLESYWALGEASGNRVDSVGVNTFTATGSPGNAAAIQGNGIQLVRASGQYLTKTDTAALRTLFSGDFTLQMWVKLANKTNRQALLSKYDGGANIVILVEYSLSADRVRFWMRNAAAGDNQLDCPTLGAPAINTWYHVLLGMSGTTQWARINGGTKDTRTFTGTRNTTTCNLEVGARVTADNPDAIIDECALWSRALTTAEENTLYNSGAGVPYPTFA